MRFEFSSRLLLALLLSITLALGLNVLTWWYCGGSWRDVSKAVFNKLTEHFGNPLAQLLRRAAVEEKQVLLSLKSRKVYCGRVIEVPEYFDQAGQFVEIFPAFSCCRDKDKLNFVPQSRTEYPALTYWEAMSYLDFQEKFRAKLEEIASSGAVSRADLEEKFATLDERISEAKAVVSAFNSSGDFDYRDWIKVVPVSEIETASMFDSRMYDFLYSQPDDLPSTLPVPANP